MLGEVKNKSKTFKVAVVGCGRISVNHVKSIALQSHRSRLVALCDLKLERIDQSLEVLKNDTDYSDEYIRDIEKFSSYDELIQKIENQKIKIDLIVLATPSGLHASQVIKAAKVGVNICTEKPMATKYEDGLEMIKACEKAKVKLYVVKQNRFNATLQLLKKQIDKGRFGQISTVSVNVFWQRPQEYYDQDKWRGTWEYDGGALMNQATHYVDLLDWLIGPVEYISASIATLGRNIEVEDTAAIQLKWKGGALGTMAVTMLTYPKNLEGSITILGENGSVKVAGKAVNKIEYWYFADKTNDDNLVEKASYETTSVYGFGHPSYYNNLFNNLEGKEEAMCDGKEGLKSLELVIGAYKSAKNKEVVYLPLSN